MTLSFTQKWGKSMGDLAGQPNYFVEKIYRGFLIKNTFSSADFNKEFSKVKNSKTIDEIEGYRNRSLIHPKLHTIREDKSNRWRPGMNIHFVVNNRTKDRLQFAPILKCIHTQEIEISNSSNGRSVIVDSLTLSFHGIKSLALNDGFPNMDSFFNYFRDGFKGKIIHWTNTRY